jgi:hypothetical protein
MNELLTITKSFVHSKSSVIYLMPLSIYFICYSKRLFSVQILVVIRFWCYAVVNKSNKASGWQIKAIYTPWARCLRYSCYRLSSFLLINWIFLLWSFYIRYIILFSFIITVYLLNIRLNLADSLSLGFAVN